MFVSESKFKLLMGEVWFSFEGIYEKSVVCYWERGGGWVCSGGGRGGG